MIFFNRAGLIVIAMLAWPMMTTAQEVHVTLRETAPGTYFLNGEFVVQASSSTAWNVITDYDNIGKFVSSIRFSRVLKREPDSAVIEQEGSGRFLFFSRRVKLTLAVKESPPDHVGFRDIKKSQFNRYEGSWTITSSTSGCSVKYELVAAPNTSLVLKFATKSVLRKNVRQLLNEVRAEIERRTHLDM